MAILDPTIDSILDKIHKLQGLTVDRGATTAEAASAAARIQEMLFKFNLDMADVDAHGPAPAAPSITQEDGTMGPRSSEHAWRGPLLHAVCTYNFCRSIRRGDKGKGVVTIVGAKHNIVVAQHLTDFLAGEILRLAKIAMDAAGLRGSGRTSWSRAFALGAVREIRTRLQEERRANVAAAPTSTAMVLVSDAQLTARFRELFPRQTKMRGASTRQVDAYGQGRAAGRGIQMHRPLASSGGHAALGR